MTTGRTLARAAAIVTLAGLLSRALGYVRVFVIGSTFGAGPELDAFIAAFRIPDLIFQLVAAGALASSLIPVIAYVSTEDGDERAWRVVSTVANLLMPVLLVLSLLAAIAAPVLVPAITPGFDEVQSARTIELTRIMLLSPVFLALGAIATSVLNSRGRFGASAVAPIAYNVAIIFAAVFLAPFLGVVGLALGVVIGSLLHVVVQLRPLRRLGFRYEPAIDAGDRWARRAFALLAPRAIGLGASQITLIVSTMLASGLAAGSITAFAFAFTLLQIPIGVIGVPVGIVVFPTLSQDMARGGVTAFVDLVLRALRLLLFVMIPIAVVGMVLNDQIVTLLLAYGTFDEAAVALTASTLFFFLLGLPAHSLIAVLARAFYAQQDTRTPVAVAVLAVAVNVSLSIILVGPIGLNGLALAIAIGAWAEALVLMWLLRRRVAELRLSPLLRVGVEAGLGAAAAGLAAAGVVVAVDQLTGAEGRLIVLVATALAGLAALGAFVVVSAALRVPELQATVELVRDVTRRRRG